MAAVIEEGVLAGENLALQMFKKMAVQVGRKYSTSFAKVFTRVGTKAVSGMTRAARLSRPGLNGLKGLKGLKGVKGMKGLKGFGGPAHRLDYKPVSPIKEMGKTKLEDNKELAQLEQIAYIIPGELGMEWFDENKMDKLPDAAHGSFWWHHDHIGQQPPRDLESPQSKSEAKPEATSQAKAQTKPQAKPQARPQARPPRARSQAESQAKEVLAVVNAVVNDAVFDDEPEHFNASELISSLTVYTSLNAEDSAAWFCRGHLDCRRGLMSNFPPKTGNQNGSLHSGEMSFDVMQPDNKTTHSMTGHWYALSERPDEEKVLASAEAMLYRLGEIPVDGKWCDDDDMREPTMDEIVSLLLSSAIIDDELNVPLII